MNAQEMFNRGPRLVQVRVQLPKILRSEPAMEPGSTRAILEFRAVSTLDERRSEHA